MQIAIKYQPTEARLEDGEFWCVHPDTTVEWLTTDFMGFGGADQFETPYNRCTSCMEWLDEARDEN